MKRIAKFEKVSKENFINAWSSMGKEKSGCSDIFDGIKLPKRATVGSAGYDFFSPHTFTIKTGESVVVPTGVRVCIESGWVLKIYPRSGLGFKYRLQLNNTVGIIDSDYYYSDNQGHIFVKLTNDGRQGKSISVSAGEAFCQGVFVEYGITFDDSATELRNGGFGSTDQ